jgi:putative Holliday junction resolvase
MRYLAIDFGERRVGLATGDDETRIASPLDVVATGSEEERDRQLEVWIADREPDALVLGLPLLADGSEGPAAKRVRAIAAAWERRFRLPVHLVDEHLSSYVADQQMSHSGLTRGKKKMRRDALAAATILRDFFASRDRS